MIDLHECTQEDALNKLNDLLPVWMSDAMKDFPYTCRVDIVTGGGNQILAETVEHWIQETRHVAN